MGQLGVNNLALLELLSIPNAQADVTAAQMGVMEGDSLYLLVGSHLEADTLVVGNHQLVDRLGPHQVVTTWDYQVVVWAPLVVVPHKSCGRGL